jgi:hypothetical protein
MWLNEAFAEYTSNIATHYIDPDIHTWERFYVEETQLVMYKDMNTSEHWAMTSPVTTRCNSGRLDINPRKLNLKINKKLILRFHFAQFNVTRNLIAQIKLPRINVEPLLCVSVIHSQGRH